jgi:hypothetical protein
VTEELIIERDSRDEGVDSAPKPTHRRMSPYYHWTEPLGVLLYETLNIVDPKSDPSIAVRVGLLEETYPILTDRIWKLIESAKDPICFSRSADVRLVFFAQTEEGQQATSKMYHVYLPLDAVELHNLLQRERV